MDKCNLTLWEGPEGTKKQETGVEYSDLLIMAQRVAEGLSLMDKERLRANPTPEELKRIMKRRR